MYNTLYHGCIILKLDSQYVMLVMQRDATNVPISIQLMASYQASFCHAAKTDSSSNSCEAMHAIFKLIFFFMSHYQRNIHVL